MDKLLGQKVKEINDFYNSIIIHTENNTQHELNLEDIFGPYSAYNIVELERLVGQIINQIHIKSNTIEIHGSTPTNSNPYQYSYIYAAGIKDIDSAELSSDKQEILIHAHSLNGDNIQLHYFKKIKWSLSAFSKEKLPSDLQHAIDEINLFEHPKIKQITDNLNRENAERVSGHMKVYFNSKLNK